MSPLMRMLGLGGRVSSKTHRFTQRRTVIAHRLPSRFVSSMPEPIFEMQRPVSPGGARRNRKNTVTARALDVNSLDSKLTIMDQYVRRCGRITRMSLEEAIKKGKEQGGLNSTQTLQLLRATGAFTRECSPEARTALTETVWKLANPKQLDISHYNALLQAYLENNTAFDPQTFLVQLKDAGVAPNRVTYQRLIQRFCDVGDVAGASKVIEFMKSERIPVSERVFNALIKGHVLTGDLESANKVLEAMTAAELHPSSETFTVFASSLIEKGFATKAFETIEGHNLSDEQILRLAKAFALKDDIESVKKVISKLPRSIGFGQDIINACFEILSHKKLAVAEIIFNHLPYDPSQGPSGNYFISQMVKSGLSLPDVTNFCNKLKEQGKNDDGLVTATHTSLQSADRSTCIDYVKLMSSNGYPLRPHMFYPIICKATHEAEIWDTLREMHSLKVPMSEELLIDYVLPRVNCEDSEKIIKKLLEAGCFLQRAVYYLAKYFLIEGQVDKCLALLNENDCPLTGSLITVAANMATPKNIGKSVQVLNKVFENQAPSKNARDLVGEFLRAVPNDTFNEAVGQVARQKQLQIGRTSYEQLLKRGDCVRALHINMVEDEALSQPSKYYRERRPIQPMATEEMEKRLRVLETQNADWHGLACRLLIAYSREREFDKVDKMLQKLENQELSGSVLASLIDLNVYKGDLQTALKYYTQVKKLENFVVDDFKVINLAALSVQEGHFAEAKDILNSHGFKDITDNCQQSAMRLVRATVEKNGIEEALKLVDEQVSKFSVITPSILGPIMKASLDKGDVNESLALFKNIANRYRVTPMKREFIIQLIAADANEVIDEVCAVSSELYGSFSTKIDLSTYYAECELFDKARELLRKCPLNRVQRRIESLCEGFVERKQVKELEAFVRLIAEFGYNQDELYYLLMRGYCRDDNIDKALEQWTRAQEENIILSNRTLRYLARVLERNGREVPFVVPSEFEPPAADNFENATSNNFNSILKHSVAEAVKFREESLKDGRPLTVFDESNLIAALTEDNQLKTALKIFREYLQAYKEGDMHLRSRTIRLLLSALAQEKMVDDLISLRPLLSDKLRKIYAYDDMMCNAYVAAGRISECLDILDKVPITETAGHGWINAVLDSHPDALGRICEVAKRLARDEKNLNMLRLIWTHLFSDGKYDEADALMAEFPQIPEQNLSVKRILSRMRENKDEVMSARLLAVLKEKVQPKRVYAIALSAHIDILLEKGLVEEAQKQLKDASADGFDVNTCHAKTLDTLKRELALQGKEVSFRGSEQSINAYA
ncbi:leucine-rich PPR motif-containing protein, mitochondrial-like [Varroa destructor]|uniref:Leucine-rich PPR motif-containing protein, mitochondrial n=1 Tax=Varroa destructor TaxID=109461 RepID=A0A7M7J520_VARDE|nr:leucine-rich PPR motif-containing protein, mitochondrial-like [Varroa destructor]